MMRKTTYSIVSTLVLGFDSNMVRWMVRHKLLFAATALVGLFAACDRDEFAKKSPFPHATHASAGLECSMCHEAVDEGQMGYPSPEICAGCHEFTTDDPVGEICAKCHKLDDAFAEQTAFIQHRLVPDFKCPVPGSFADVHFDHTPYVDDEEQCLVCHAEVEDEEVAEVFLPTMDQVLAFFASSGGEEPSCSTCHLELSADSPPKSHTLGNWTKEHGTVADFEGTETCGYCHGENTCTTCHEVTQPQSHTALFRIKTHGLEAQWGRERCATCHRDDFCQSCHREVEPRSHRGGWSGPMNNHCVNCHVEDGENSNCFACHEQGMVDQTHVLSAPAPVSPFHVAGAACLICHDPVSGVIQPRLRHPLVEEEQCGLCHRF